MIQGKKQRLSNAFSAPSQDKEKVFSFFDLRELKRKLKGVRGGDEEKEEGEEELIQAALQKSTQDRTPISKEEEGPTLQVFLNSRGRAF